FNWQILADSKNSKLIGYSFCRSDSDDDGIPGEIDFKVRSNNNKTTITAFDTGASREDDKWLLIAHQAKLYAAAYNLTDIKITCTPADYKRADKLLLELAKVGLTSSNYIKLRNTRKVINGNRRSARVYL
ncbi:MAG: hypothetical protein COC15_02595, partial [Legionellales bacterium]